MRDKSWVEELESAKALGLHPKWLLEGDGLLTDDPITEDDRKMGDVLAHLMGDPYADIVCQEHASPGCFLYRTLTPVEHWTRVARCLRLLSLSVKDAGWPHL